jgi:hypothetical protein
MEEDTATVAPWMATRWRIISCDGSIDGSSVEDPELRRLHGRKLGGGSVGGEYRSCWRLTISRDIQVAGPTAISPLFTNAGEGVCWREPKPVKLPFRDHFISDADHGWPWKSKTCSTRGDRH